MLGEMMILITLGSLLDINLHSLKFMKDYKRFSRPSILLIESAYFRDKKRGIRTTPFFLSTAQHLREQNLLVALIGLYSFRQILHFLIGCLMYALPFKTFWVNLTLKPASYIKIASFINYLYYIIDEIREIKLFLTFLTNELNDV